MIRHRQTSNCCTKVAAAVQQVLGQRHFLHFPEELLTVGTFLSHTQHPALSCLTHTCHTLGTRHLQNHRRYFELKVCFQMWIRPPKTLKYPRKVTPPQSRSIQLLQIFMWWWFVICRTFAWETHERLLIWGLLIVFGPRSITIWPNNCHTISTNHQYQPMDFLIQPTSLSLKIVPPHSRSFQNVYLPLKSWIPHWSQSMCFVTLSFILLCYCWLHFKSMCYDAALRIAPTTLPFTRIPPACEPGRLPDASRILLLSPSPPPPLTTYIIL